MILRYKMDDAMSAAYWCEQLRIEGCEDRCWFEGCCLFIKITKKTRE